MSAIIHEYEAAIRLSLFLGVFVVVAIAEHFAPRRPLSIGKGTRWSANLGIVTLNTLVLRLLFPAAAVGLAVLAQDRQWGVLNYYAWPYALEVVIAIIVLDFAIYLQHVMFHAVPVFWRLHRMHHADLDFDVTTGVRFHPIEIVLSMLIKFAVIVALGPPALGVLIFEVLLNATAMFSHANLRLPLRVDSVLRRIIVTPDMHRVHHSIERHETNSNFGFNFSLWDRLCGTYRAEPEAGHDAMTIGISRYRDPKQVARITGMLAIPWSGQATDYSINRRKDEKND